MLCREATSADAVAIATLHADSWRVAYRGALDDAYLDRDVVEDRFSVWLERLSAPAQNQRVVVAEDGQHIVGFACAYGRDDDRWGTLLDNIHVRRGQHGQGMGKRLLADVAAWSATMHSGAGLYLWVVELNQAAQRFYQHLGATDRGDGIWIAPGGREVKTRRYAWSADELASARKAW